MPQLSGQQPDCTCRGLRGACACWKRGAADARCTSLSPRTGQGECWVRRRESQSPLDPTPACVDRFARLGRSWSLVLYPHISEASAVAPFVAGPTCPRWRMGRIERSALYARLWVEPSPAQAARMLNGGNAIRSGHQRPSLGTRQRHGRFRVESRQHHQRPIRERRPWAMRQGRLSFSALPRAPTMPSCTGR